MNNELLKVENNENIEKRIFVVRGMQVMLDSDVAELFEMEVRRINEQMKRNIERFPEDFCFQLNSSEFNNLRSQNAIFEKAVEGRKYLPYVYTEQGIMALSGAIKNDFAVEMSIKIVRTFISMRKFILENGDVLLKLAQLQNRQINFEIETNKRFDEVLKMINKVDLPKQALFFDGQYYDAYDFIASLVRKAKQSLILIDPYCDNRALSILSNKNDGVDITICKSSKSKLTQEEINVFAQQYSPISILNNDVIHDRFLIMDKVECYSLGASLNHVGKKTFVVTMIEDEIIINSIAERIGIKKRMKSNDF